MSSSASLINRSILLACRFNDQRWFLRRAGIDESSESSSLQVKSFLPCSREHNKSRRWPTGRRMAAPRQKPHVAVEVPAEFTGSTSAALYAQYHANIQSLTPATAQVARSRRSVSRNDRRSIRGFTLELLPPNFFAKRLLQTEIFSTTNGKISTTNGKKLSP